jgi:hypothetical protein
VPSGGSGETVGDGDGTIEGFGDGDGDGTIEGFGDGDGDGTIEGFGDGVGEGAGGGGATSLSPIVRLNTTRAPSFAAVEDEGVPSVTVNVSIDSTTESSTIWKARVAFVAPAA